MYIFEIYQSFTKPVLCTHKLYKNLMHGFSDSIQYKLRMSDRSDYPTRTQCSHQFSLNLSLEFLWLYNAFVSVFSSEEQGRGLWVGDEG